MTKTIKTLSEAECEQIFLTQNKIYNSPLTNQKHIRNRAMIKLMLETGLRVGELVKLEILDLFRNLEPVNWLHVRREIAKNKTPRDIPLSGTARSTIFEMYHNIWFFYCLQPSDPAFCGPNPHKAITARQVERIVKEIGLLALKADIYPHMLRHTFATRILRTSNVRIVQQLLGHKRIATTQLYTHPNNQDLRDAINRAEPAL